MDEQIIEFVRSHEELYNFADKRYSDNAHKQKLWEEIARELQKSSEYCKKRWESLRAQFRKVCRLRKTTTGQAAGNNKTWKYEENFSFLLPYMKDKARVTSLDTVGDLSDDEPLREDNVTDGENSQVPNADASQIESGPSNSGNRNITPQQNRKRARTSEKNRCSVSGTATSSATLMKYIIDKKGKEQEEEEKDELYHFFEGIKRTVKKFSPTDVHLAKKKIFLIISEIEATYLNNEISEPPTQPQYQTLVPIPLTSPAYSAAPADYSNTTSCSSFYEQFSPN